jgi:DNA-binding transcriptional LysR family regulator
MRGLATGSTAQLRIFAPVFHWRAWFVPHIAVFMAKHPYLDVGVKLPDHKQGLVEEKIDIAAHIAQTSDPTDQERKLPDVPRHIVGSPAW